jgi:hypothetical protein
MINNVKKRMRYVVHLKNVVENVALGLVIHQVNVVKTKIIE